MTDEKETITKNDAEPKGTSRLFGLERTSFVGLAVAGVAAVSGITAFTWSGSGSEAPSAQPTYMPAAERRMERPPIPQNKPGEVDFIVRFEDVPAIKECLDTFRSDPDHARSVFEAFAKDYPGLAGFRLKKTNYSGELVLTWTGDGERPGREQIMSVRERLQSMSAVKYADPDFSTQIEGNTE